ncbi:MAG: peptidylprolyl isomerase [Candidatus Limivicinus sp.]
MKKLVVILAAVCILFAGVVGYMSYINRPVEDEPAAEPETSQALDAEESGTEVQTLSVDYDAMRASHEPDEVVATCNGRDVRWDEYFYWASYNAAQVENYINTMATYGLSVSWDDPWSQDSAETYAEFVTANAEEQIKQVNSVEDFAAENNVVLSDEVLAEMDEQLKSTIASVCGEDATEEDFNEYLDQAYLTRELYDRMNRMNYLYQQGYTQLYGETGELVDDATAIAYLEDNDYISANHILLMTVDSATGEALDEETIAAQEQKAQEIAKELQAIEDPQLLLTRFAELKEEYCEDTGKATYPDGYTFTPGTMVTEFEDASNALEDYQVSDPVLTSYGYHVIIRLPFDPDRVMEYSNEGTPLTARSLAANAEYASRMDAQYEKTVFELVPGFSFNIKDFLK